MGKFVDFVVEYHPDPMILGQRIIRNIMVSRLKGNKPVFIFVSGDSGEGKSYTGLKLLEILGDVDAFNTGVNVDAQVVYTPLQYANKIEDLLFNKKFKKLRGIQLDEAREVMKAKLWHSFLNQALADIQVMVRKIKPIVVIVVSQFIKDVDKDLRATITYYVKVVRPLGKRTRVTIHRVWKDDRDIEAPKLRRRKLRGFIIKDGKKISFTPSYFEIGKPNKEVCDTYEELNLDAKTGIIKRKLEQILSEVQKEMGEPDKKVNTIVKFYLDNPASIHMVMKQSRGKLKIKKEVSDLHGFTKSEVEDFKEKLLKGLERKKIIAQTKNLLDGRKR